MADRKPIVSRLGDPAAFEPALSYKELLGRRLVLNSRVRFVMAGMLLAGPWLGLMAGAMAVRTAAWLSASAVALLAFNTFFFVRARRHVEPQASAGAYLLLRRLVYTAVAVDYVVLALAVALLGGVRSPVTAFYLLHVVLGSMMLTREAAVGFSLLAYLLICAQAYAELAGWAVPAALTTPAYSAPLDGFTAFGIAGVYGVLFLVTDALVISLVEWLRASELELRWQNERLDQLSQLRRDFLRVAIHNLRSPVGAAQMLLENLVAGLAGPLNNEQQNWVLRIGRRMEGLQELLQDLRVLGDLETEDVAGQAESVDLDAVVLDVVEEYAEQARMVGVELVPKPGRAVPRVKGIRRLVREAIVNFVSNAIKYAPHTGEVFVETHALPASWGRVVVRDAGPGVPADQVPRLFQEFAPKVRKPSGPEHPASSGLGLSIARRIAEAHGGRVGVDTAPGRGSAFWMELPGAPAAE